MPNNNMHLDRVFHALSDPTRRAVLARLGRGPAAVSELARPFDMTLPSFTQHLGVLEECGLVSSEKKGRVRTYSIVPGPLEVGRDHGLGIGLGLGAALAELLGCPQAQRLVAARGRLEAQFLVMRELALEAFLAVLHLVHG